MTDHKQAVFIANCRPCNSRPLVFTTYEAREEWMEEHREETGHYTIGQWIGVDA